MQRILKQKYAFKWIFTFQSFGNESASPSQSQTLFAFRKSLGLFVSLWLVGTNISGSVNDLIAFIYYFPVFNWVLQCIECAQSSRRGAVHKRRFTLMRGKLCLWELVVCVLIPLTLCVVNWGWRHIIPRGGKLRCARTNEGASFSTQAWWSSTPRTVWPRNYV